MLLLLALLGCRKAHPDSDGGVDSADSGLPDGLLVETLPATSLGTDAFSVNGRVQPRGAPGEWYVEYGLTSAYGSETPRHTLGPRLAAHYVESWDDGLGGWRGGSGLDLVYHDGGGASGGFARYMEPTGTDYNHSDGIGWLHLLQYFYPGHFWLDYPSACLGGCSPDFTDALVELQVRGVDWENVTSWPDDTVPTPFFRGDELVWWSQVDATEAEDASHMSNWAHTGTFLTDALYSGEWTPQSYRLRADTRDWSYGGQDRSQDRDVYVYHPLREVLFDLDVDFFHLLLFIDDTQFLHGGVDFDEMHITYRNMSLLYEGNGGTLVASPQSASDPAALNDGWRVGDGHTWLAEGPTAPLVFDYALADPVLIHSIQIHNDPAHPSQDIEVLTSDDGIDWTPLASGVLPEVGEHGANFAYWLQQGLAAPARYVRVVVQSGYQDDAWGLGEIELYGSGATMATDDDWYSVTEDVTGLLAGETYHYRVVAVTDEQTIAGEDRTFTVPTGAVPIVETGDASAMGGPRVRVAGVVNNLGGEGTYAFELGSDTAYGLTTTPTRTGQELTPRTFARILDFDHPDLDGFPSGSTVHWRLTYCEGCVTLETEDDVVTAGADATFVVP